MDDLLADFLTETNEGLADLDVALVKLERTPDDGETLSLIFRLVHTIKGTCGFLGLPRLEHVAHAAENVLGKVRDGVLTVTPDMISLVLMAVDQVKAILAGLAATGAEPTGDDTELVDTLNATASGNTPPQRARRLRKQLRSRLPLQSRIPRQVRLPPHRQRPQRDTQRHLRSSRANRSPLSRPSG